MRSLESVLLQWLQLQCQMIAKVDQGILLRHGQSEREQLLLKWPARSELDNDLTQLIKTACDKRKLTLQKTTEQQLLVALPLNIGGAYWGLLALRLQTRPQKDLQACLALLKWGSSWLQLLLMQRQDNADANLLKLFSSTLQQPSLTESAICFVNALAHEFNAERVSLGLLRKKSIHLSAVSHNANFDRRTEQMQALSEAMNEAVEQRVDIQLPQPSEARAISRNHQALLQLQPAKSIHTVLLRHNKKIIAALTLERNSECPLSSAQLNNLQQSASLAAQIFELKLQADEGVRSRLRSKSLQFLHARLSPRHLTGKLTAAALALALLILMIPAQHWVYADAELQSQHKRIIVAPQDGYLDKIYARPGTQVAADSILADLDDSDLRLQRRKLLSQLQQHQQEYDEALANYDRAAAAITAAQVKQAEAQLLLTEQQLQRSHLKSPMAGLVISDDISQNLGAPVEQGQVLFIVASSDQYRVSLRVDERDISALQEQQSGRMILTSLPDIELSFNISKITPLSEVQGGRNFFVVEGLLQQTSQQVLLRPGMTGAAKVLAGRRSLGWIWFHDVINSVRLFLWL